MNNQNKLSINNYIWKQRGFNLQTKEAIKQKFRFPDLVSTAIATRHSKLEDVENFLKPNLSHSIPDPYHLKDMDKAIKYIAKIVLVECLQVIKKVN